MTYYTLHFGVEYGDAEDVRALIKEMVSLSPPALRERVGDVYCDGDSFLEWGEVDVECDYLHGQVRFSAHTDLEAWSYGTAMFTDLLQHEDPVAILSATCMTDHHVPFAITLAHDWSIEAGHQPSVVENDRE